jgi:catechol 2,3-dioxygenase-like lactoylglutathione lyase family enzyme
LQTEPPGARHNNTSRMQPYDLAIPTLPCRSVSVATAFYRQLGFEGGAHAYNSQYAIFTRGAIELHFFTHRELVPAESSAGCYIRVQDVESLYKACSVSGLPSSGIPRLDSIENKPWGLREFSIVDPDGNLLRIGQVVRD